VFTRHQRRAGLNGARRRPPGTEHVPVHHLLIAQCESQPLGERLAARVLKRRSTAEHLDTDALRTKQGESFACRVTREPARLDSVGAQCQGQTQRAELRTTRLEHRDHTRHSHPPAR
jgi:hypothetical protein